MKQTIKAYLETTCGQTCNNGSEEGSEEAATVLTALVKQWALEMVEIDDSDLCGDECIEKAINKIRQRIEESTK